MHGKFITACMSLLAFAVMITAQAAIVHVSDFNSPAGTNPNATNDATRVWAVDGTFTGGAFGHYTYTGTGQLNLVAPSHAYDDPFLELDTLTSGILALNESFEIVLDCLLSSTEALGNQGMILALTDAAPANVSTWNTGEIALLACNRWGIIRIMLTNDPSTVDADMFELNKVSRAQAIDIPAAEITNLRLILTHDAGTSTYKAFASADGGTLYEIPQTFTVTHTKPVINITKKSWFSSAFEVNSVSLDNLMVANSITTTDGDERWPLTERVFQALDDPSSEFYTTNIVGDLNELYKPGSNIFNYNTTGQLVVGHSAGNTGWPNAKINLVSNASAPETQVVIDVKPGFTNDGVLQMFNLWFGGDWSLQVANANGLGRGMGVFWWQDNIYALDAADAGVIPGPPSNLTDLRLVFTYKLATQEVSLYYSWNGGPVYSHPNSPQTYARTATQVEFQWQVWSSSNPSAFTVALDNFKEYDYIDVNEAPFPTAAGPDWSLYQ